MNSRSHSRAGYHGFPGFPGRITHKDSREYPEDTIHDLNGADKIAQTQESLVNRENAEVEGQ